MKNLPNRQKHFLIFFFTILAYNTIQFLVDDSSVILKIWLGITYLIIIVWLIYFIFSKIKFFVSQNNTFDKKYYICKDIFNDLKNLHATRYKLYFKKNFINQINIYTEEIQEKGEELLDYANEIISDPNISTTQKQLIQDIIDETEELLSRESVNFKP